MKYRTAIQGHIEYAATMTGGMGAETNQVEIEVRKWRGHVSLSVRTKDGWGNVPLPEDAALELARLLTQVHGAPSTPEGK